MRSVEKTLNRWIALERSALKSELGDFFFNFQLNWFFLYSKCWHFKLFVNKIPWHFRQRSGFLFHSVSCLFMTSFTQYVCMCCRDTIRRLFFHNYLSSSSHFLSRYTLYNKYEIQIFVMHFSFTFFFLVRCCSRFPFIYSCYGIYFEFCCCCVCLVHVSPSHCKTIHRVYYTLNDDLSLFSFGFLLTKPFATTFICIYPNVLNKHWLLLFSTDAFINTFAFEKRSNILCRDQCLVKSNPPLYFVVVVVSKMNEVHIKIHIYLLKPNWW